MKHRKLVAALFILSLAGSSCMKEMNEETMATDPVQRSANSSTEMLQLSFTGLQDLGPNARYEGWIIVNGAAISTGKFRVTPSGMIAPAIFNVDRAQLMAATKFVLTIEPMPDPSAAPSGIKILAGDFSASTATLTVGHMDAIGNDFTSPTGKFLLATPTTATMTDEKSGVWFIDNTSGSPMPGLVIPILPSGWKYEGWTVINGTALTSGKFLFPNMADMAAPFSGSLPGPPFPGEDYVANAPAGFTFPTDLSGSTIVVTIEPNPDFSPDPFFLKPLAGMVPVNATDHVSYPMTNIAASFPTGTATR
jgi:hypothetical protein